MTVRKKTLIIIGVTLACLIGILYGASRMTLLSGFEQLEDDNTYQNVQRASSALSDEISNLENTTWDWAAWDDTYTFIEDANTAYIQSNLIDGTFTSLSLNLMLFIDSSGQIVFSKAFDLQNEEEIALPQSLQQHLGTGDLLLQHTDTESSVSGIVLLTEDPMLVASCPIITSEDEGPIRGTLIMGRYLDDTEIQSLAAVTHLSLTAYPFDDSQMPSDFQAVLPSLSEDAPIAVKPLTSESVAGYALLNDVYGQPALVLKADMARDIYQQGQSSMLYFVLLLVAAGLVFGVVFMLILERLVLSRVNRLASSVSSIGASGDPSARVTMTGKDELSRLAGDINGMLQELQNSQEEMRIRDGAIASSINAIAIANLEGYLTYVNASFLKLWGYDNEEQVLGKRTAEFWQMGEQAEEVMEAILREGGWQGELVASRKDGSTFDVQVSASIATDEAGKPICMMASFIDITKRKQAEQQVKEYSENLERMVEERTRELKDAQEKLIRSEKLAAIGELAGGVGHELRSPLTAIRGSVYFLNMKLGGTAEEKVARHLDILQRQVNNCDKIISDLLDFSRPGTTRSEEVDINQVVRKVVEATTPPENVEISTTLAGNLPPAIVDEGQIEQVLSNLITNAIQAMLSGGRLSLSTDQAGSFIEVRVADEGVGIPEENLDKVFEPLFTTKAKGVGLGLSLAKRLVERQGGTIQVESQVGKGTTFTVKLPVDGEEVGGP